MDETIRRLEAMLERMANPDDLEADELERLPQEWQQGVDELLRAVNALPASGGNPVRRQRVQAILDKMPQTIKAIEKTRADVFQRIQSENKRSQSLRHAETDTRAQSARLLNRKA